MEPPPHGESGSNPERTTKAKVLVVDDHPIVCQGLADLVNRQTDLCCCKAVGSIVEAEKAITAQKPDAVLLDLRMGSADGLETIKSLKARHPELRILTISQSDESVYAERALRAGSSGYVMKEQATEEVLQALRAVLKGDMYVSPKISMMAVKRVLEGKPQVPSGNLSALTDRELHVFKAVGAGKANKQIAAELGLSVKTIETYREHIKYKLGLSSGAELSARARQSAQDESRAP